MHLQSYTAYVSKPADSIVSKDSLNECESIADALLLFLLRPCMTSKFQSASKANC